MRNKYITFICLIFILCLCCSCNNKENIRINTVDKKKQDVKYPDYWDGNIYICGSIFIYGSDNFYCSLPWNLREKGVSVRLIVCSLHDSMDKKIKRIV